MAKAKNNATDLMSGRVDQFVFRDWFGETIVSKKPKKSGKEPTEDQLAIRRNFKAAARFAKMAIDSPTLRPFYESKRQPKKNAYVMAMVDFFTVPQITKIDTEDYSGAIGSTILVGAEEDIKVNTVKVRINRADGTLVEQGVAVPGTDTVLWQYTATVNNASLAGCIVTVTAYDIPGNTTVEQKTL